MDLMWTYSIHDTRSGELIGNVAPSGASFSRVLNGIGDGTHTFALSEFGVSGYRASHQRIRKALSAPWARTLVQSWDGVPRYAGCLTRRTVDVDKNQITLASKEVREVFRKRYTFGENGYQGEGGGRFIIEKNTIESLVSWLIWQGMQGVGDNWALPILVPPRNVAGPHTRIWEDYNLPVIESAMTELQNAYDGPDIDFQQQWAADGTLQWQARVGNLTGRTLEWVVSADRSRSIGITVVEDGAKAANMVYAVGDGQERKKLVRKAKADTDQPALERAEMYTQLKDKGWLQGHADADLQTFRNPTEQLSFSMMAGDNPGVNDLVLGQRLRLHTKNHIWFADGWHDYRLIGYSGDHTDKVDLQVQLIEGV